jgi:sulfoxide reductase heme-binding subunit YedZ
VLPVVGGSSSEALWYATRATGLVALVLLTGTVVLGAVSSRRRTSTRWPAFASQTLHRNLSLLALALVAVHVVTTVADTYVPIGLVSVVVPFTSSYRTLWIGLGAVAFDLMAAVLVTSALRHRIGFRAWRLVHWSAYLCWPIAFVHGLEAGTDTGLPVVLALDVACAVAVVGTTTWRMTAGRPAPRRRLATGTHPRHRPSLPTPRSVPAPISVPVHTHSPSGGPR